jgi:hypothetical protein
MSTKVFISAGTPADESQRSFRDAIVNAIKLAGFVPRLMDPKDWDYKNPLRGVRRAMEECRGAVVVAYARYQVNVGAELRLGGEQPLESVAFPTAWNQIEAAMAYEKGLPLLVVAEKRLRREALLDSANDIRPFWTDLDPGISGSDGFQGYLRSWKLDVEKYAKEPISETALLQQFTARQVISSLPWFELIALFGSLSGALVGMFTVGYRVGKGLWPFV